MMKMIETKKKKTTTEDVASAEKDPGLKTCVVTTVTRKVI